MNVCIWCRSPDIRICNARRHRIVMIDGWEGVGESGCSGQAWSAGDDAVRDAEK